MVVTAQLSPIAKFYGVDKAIVAFGTSALVLAIQMDHLEALSVFGLLRLIHRPAWFILLSGLCFFAWGEIFSLFPSITGDLFGKTWATTNYGIVYTAKGLASIFAGPVAALASTRTGSWVPVFWAMITCDLVAAFMALLWLKPVAARTIARAKMMLQPAEMAAEAKGGEML